MTTRRRSGGENEGNGVSYRVAVCRKRLRISRTTLRVESNPRLDGYSLISPSVANDLTSRQKLFPRTVAAATVATSPALIEVSLELGVEKSTPVAGSVPQEKAEDT